jgi:hypothetical protein
MAACLDRTGNVAARALQEDSCEVLFPGSSAVEWTVVYRQVGGSNPFLGRHFSFKWSALVREYSFGALLHAVRTGRTGSSRVTRLETVGTAAFQNGARRRVRQGSVSSPERYCWGVKD